MGPTWGPGSWGAAVPSGQPLLRLGSERVPELTNQAPARKTWEEALLPARDCFNIQNAQVMFLQIGKPWGSFPGAP